MKVDDATIQKLKTPGDYPIEVSTELVLFKAGPGVTQALLPPAKKNLVRVIRAVRAIVGTSPTIVHRVAVTGDDRILVRDNSAPSGVTLATSVELDVDGAQVTLLGIEPGLWAASFK